VITHAGLGTVMTALAHGVPLLCVPLGRDQFFNAARVEALGAGRTIGADADADTIGQAIRALLRDETARAAAKRMADAISVYRNGDGEHGNHRNHPDGSSHLVLLGVVRESGVSARRWCQRLCSIFFP